MEVSIIPRKQANHAHNRDHSLILSSRLMFLLPRCVATPTEKPLKVEVVVDPAKVSAASAAAPKGPKGAAAAGAAKGKGGRAAAGASTRGRGRARGAKREARPKKTVEDLDAEMEDYNKQATTDAAPAA